MTFLICKDLFSGEEESGNITPRQLYKTYHLDMMIIAVRPVQLQPDGITYHAQPDAPIVLSNRFVGSNFTIK